MKITYLFIGLLIFGFSNSQDLSGKWVTDRTNGFYGELNLIYEGNGRYHGHTYDEQSGGYCSYNLRANYNERTKKFFGRNTSLIRRTPDHSSSNYDLRYERGPFYEYLIGTIQVQPIASQNPFSLGLPPPPNPKTPIRYYRAVDDPILAEEGNQEEEKESITFNDPLPIPEPSEIPEPEEEELVSVETTDSISDTEPLPYPEEEPIVVIEDEKPEEYKEEKLKELREVREDKVVATYALGKKNKIKLKVRDYGEEDGDIVSIFLDDEIIVQNYEITRKARTFNIDVNPKESHRLTFVANNLGTVAPNTCTVNISIGNKSFLRKLFTDEESNAVIILDP